MLNSNGEDASSPEQNGEGWRNRAVRHRRSSRSALLHRADQYQRPRHFLPCAGGKCWAGYPAPLHKYLSALGYKGKGEAIDIEGWPVQFLPIFNPLLEEAVEQAKEVRFQRTMTRVMQAEHLVAIMLQTGLKDHARIVEFVEHDAINQKRLADILVRHGLFKKWETLNPKRIK